MRLRCPRGRRSFVRRRARPGPPITVIRGNIPRPPCDCLHLGRKATASNFGNILIYSDFRQSGSTAQLII